MLERFFGEVRGVFNVITIIDMILSIIFVILGITLFTSPSFSNLVAGIIVGICLIGNGAKAIFSFIKREDIDLFNYDLYVGVVLIILGILAIVLNNVLTIMLGIYVIVCGIQKIIYGVVLKKFHESSWLITLVIGVLFFIIGIISFFTGGDTLIKASGVCIFGYGAINLIDIILLRKRSKYFLS